MINEDILKEIRDRVSEEASKHLYEFKPTSYEQKREWCDQMLMAISEDPTISSDINHTKFPDDVIIKLLKSKGLEISDIRDIKSIDYKFYDNGYDMFTHRFQIEFHISKIFNTTTGMASKMYGFDIDIKLF